MRLSAAGEGIVDIAADAAHSFAVSFEGCELVLIEQFAVIEEATDEGGFAVIHRTGS